MLSRVASSIYWMNRYVERAENYARFIDVNLNLTLDSPPGLAEQWNPLIMITDDTKNFEEAYGVYTKDNVIKYLTYDSGNSNSILSCLAMARENARTVREVISNEMWEQLNELYLSVLEQAHEHRLLTQNLSVFYKRIKTGSHLFEGLTHATFSHGESWHFGNLGRYMERADKTARILDMKYYYLLPSVKDVGSPIDLLQWSALLKSASAFQMYRQLYGKLEVSNIIDFLIFNHEFPRAIHYCLIQAQHSIHEISGTDILKQSNDAERAIGKIRSQLNCTNVKDILDFGLHQYMDDLQVKFNDVGSSVYKTFFALREPISSTGEN